MLASLLIDLTALCMFIYNAAACKGTIIVKAVSMLLCILTNICGYTRGTLTGIKTHVIIIQCAIILKM